MAACGFRVLLCSLHGRLMNDDLIAIVEEMIEVLNDLERQLKGNDKLEE